MLIAITKSNGFESLNLKCWNKNRISKPIISESPKSYFEIITLFNIKIADHYHHYHETTVLIKRKTIADIEKLTNK